VLHRLACNDESVSGANRMNIFNSV
jgi:hypothetical protein